MNQNFPSIISWNRMASGARITLTSPDPSSNNAQPDLENDNTIFSETDTDTVIFNAHEKHTASNDASYVSIKSIETDDSASAHSHPKNVKITIDSVAPYATEEEIQSLNRVDDIDESENENEIEHTNDSNEENSEKRVKNDEL